MTIYKCKEKTLEGYFTNMLIVAYFKIVICHNFFKFFLFSKFYLQLAYTIFIKKIKNKRPWL